MTSVKKRTGARKAAAKKTPAKKIAAKKAVKKKVSVKKAVRRFSGGSRASAGKKIATAKRALQPVSVPNIDYSLCQGCGGCSEAFPHLFEMRGELAWVINPEQFDAERDAGILTICPYYAISIEKI
jgi:ferredoxin